MWVLMRKRMYSLCCVAAVSHMVFDWVSGNTYWGDAERDVVYVCARAGACRLLLDDELSKLHGLVIDPLAG